MKYYTNFIKLLQEQNNNNIVISVTECKDVTFLDISNGTYDATIEINPNIGYGISFLPDKGYGTGHDETYTNENDALTRINQIMTNGK